MDKVILVLILSFAASQKPVYENITRNTTLSFHLDNSDSSFYACLTYEEDYEIYEDNYINMNHFLRLDKKIGFKHRIIDKNGDFPDESAFNRNSKGIDSDNNYEYKSLEPFKNIRLKEYYKLGKDDKNKISIFVFYLEDKNSFDSNENFTISRLQYNNYNNNSIFEDELDNDVLKLYIFETNYSISNNSLLFINYPISTIYEYNSANYENINSNLSLYQFSNDRNSIAIFLFVYNPNEKQDLSIEYRIKNENELDLEDLKINKNYRAYGNYRNLFYVSIEPSLYYIKVNGSDDKYLYLLRDDINIIKNLSDLKSLNHYEYIREGYHYFSKKNFTIMISLSQPIILDIKKIEIKEDLKGINKYNFIYFKISKNNKLDIKLDNEIESVILKLLSSNTANVTINKVNKNINQEVQRIYIEEDNKFSIQAIDNSFIFAVKIGFLKSEIVHKTIPSTTYFNGYERKFLIYEIEYSRNYNAIRFIFDEPQNFYFNYEINYELTSDNCNYGITRGDDILFTNFEPYLDLQLYKDVLKSKKIFLYVYAENHYSNQQTFTVEFLKQLTLI